MELFVEDPGALDRAAEHLLAFAGGRRIFAFTGEMGSGKTAFIQAFCRRLGLEQEVTSPTFSLVNEYSCSLPEAPGAGPVSAGEVRIYHLDLYRLDDLEDALDLGITEFLESGAYCLIEWPELIEGLLPEDTVRIYLEIVGNSTRKILFL